MKFISILKEKILSEYILNFLHYFKGETLLKFLNILILPLYTYLLSPAEYGNVVVFMSVYGIFIIILPSNIHQSIQQRYLKNKISFNVFLSTVLFGGLLISIISCIFVFPFTKWISVSFNVPQDVIIFALICSLLRFGFEIYSKLLLAKNESKIYSNIHVYWSVVELTSTTLFFVFLSDNLYMGKAYSLLITAFLFSFYALYKVKSYIRFEFNLSMLKEALIFSIPLIMHSISIMALAQFDRIIINQLFSSNETGIYSISYSIGLIASVINIPLINAGLPKLYQNISNYNKKGIVDFIKMITKYTVIFSLFIMFFSKEGLYLLASDDYHEGYSIISIVAFSSSIMIIYLVYSHFIMYEGKTYLIAILTTISATINIILNYWLLPEFGYKFAAITTFVSNVVLIFLISIVCNKTFSLPIPGLSCFTKPVLLLFIGMLIIQIDYYYIFNFYVSFIVRILLFIMLGIIIFFETLKHRLINQN